MFYTIKKIAAKNGWFKMNKHEINSNQAERRRGERNIPDVSKLNGKNLLWR